MQIQDMTIDKADNIAIAETNDISITEERI